MFDCDLGLAVKIAGVFSEAYLVDIQPWIALRPHMKTLSASVQMQKKSEWNFHYHSAHFVIEFLIRLISDVAE